MVNTKCGFISIIGRPNAGKSTLLNALLEEKIAITSSKAQTTRNNILGILTKEEVQYVFIDTPGLHKAKHELGKTMNKGVYSSLQDIDIIYLMVDASAPFGSGDEYVLSLLQNYNAPVFLCLNKCDLLKKETVFKLIEDYSKRYDFAEIIPISATMNKNVDDLLKTSEKYLSNQPFFYPEEMVSDRSIDFRIRECIREQVLHKTEEEVPHSVAVVIENKEEDDTKLYLQAVVIVERTSQKGILIGKQASMIKSITLNAQREIKSMVNKKVVLSLYVRVEKNWRNKASKLNQLGYSESGEYE